MTDSTEVPKGILLLYWKWQTNGFAEGMFKVASMLNHSCRPNLWTRVANGQIEVRARRVIGSGEELCINYVTDPCGYPGLPWALRKERQAYLLQGYGFSCTCELCEVGQAFVESGLCPGCGGEVRPQPGGAAVCLQCGLEAECPAPGLKELAKVQRLAKLWRRGSSAEQAAGELLAQKVYSQVAALRASMGAALHEGHVARFQACALMLKVSHKILQSDRPAEERRIMLEDVLEAALQMSRAAVLWAGEEDPMLDSIQEAVNGLRQLQV